MPKHKNYNILPEYPRTPHVPYKPNMSADDVLASNHESDLIFKSDRVSVTEKVDGANCGMALYEGEAVIRNHTHILSKGFVKDTPAKKQFASIWGWFYENKKKFVALNDALGPVSVYGEWLIAQHGLEYDRLPSYFMAFDLYNYEQHQFVATDLARKFLTEIGFNVVPELFFGKIENYEQLETLANQPSLLTTKGNREGVYLKINDDRWVTHRFKMVRSDFVQGRLWNESKITKNKIM